MSTFNNPLFNTALFNGGPVGTGAGGTPVYDLIYHALRLAHVTLGPDRTPSNPMFDDGLRVMQRFIGRLNALRSSIFTVRVDLWPTANQQQSYTLGPGGDWDGPRPQRIVTANLLFNTNPPIRRPIRILTDKEWSQIRLQQIFTFPSKLYNDGNAPLSTIYFWPIPDDTFQIELYTWQALTKPVTVTDVLAFPDGYEEMLVTNMAVRLGPMFGKPVDPDVRVQAVNSWQTIISLNAESPKLSTEAALRTSGGLYNWMTGLVEE